MDEFYNLIESVEALENTSYFRKYPLGEASLKEQRVKDQAKYVYELLKKSGENQQELFEIILKEIGGHDFELKSKFFYLLGRLVSYLMKHDDNDIKPKSTDLKDSGVDATSSFFNEQFILGNEVRESVENIIDDLPKDPLILYSRAVKLDMYNFDAWIALGEVYSDNSDFESAIHCFDYCISNAGAEHSKKDTETDKKCLLAKAYTCLSMVFRRLYGSTNSNILLWSSDDMNDTDYMDRSLDLAKKAVHCDLGNGDTWMCLANAHLFKYFSSPNASNQDSLLQTALTCYKRAEQSPSSTVYNPDLHFNKGIALKYKEEYGSALHAFHMAWKLEPCNFSYKLHFEGLKKRISSISEGLDLKRREKTFKVLIEDLKKLESNEKISSKMMKQTECSQISASLSDVMKKDEASSTVLLYLKVFGIYKMSSGDANINANIGDDDRVPLSLYAADRNGDTVCVSVYNLARDKNFKVGDTLGISNPTIVEISSDVSEDCFHFKAFRLIRIDSPSQMCVNMKRLGQEYIASLQTKCMDASGGPSSS